MLLAARQVEEAAAEFEKLREPEDAESPRYLYGLAVANVQAGAKRGRCAAGASKPGNWQSASGSASW